MISKRAQSITPSETLQISDKAKKLREQGQSIVSLSAGEPDFNTPENACKAAIKAINDGFHGYTMNTGTPELRQAVCDKLERDNGLSYNSSQIVCTNGGKQALGFSMLALLDKGDEVVIPAPYWVSYPQMVKLAEGKPVPVRTSFENHYKLTPSQLDDAITERTKAFLICSPSNPTGACYTPDELRGLAEVLKSHPEITIISDEIYEYITFEQSHTGILQVAPELYERTTVVNGFSKGFAMTGWRLGYLAAPQTVVDAVAKIQSQETSAPSCISQKAGEAAYKGSLDAVNSMRHAFKERRDFVAGELRAIDGVRCFTPEGAFYVFPDISAHFGKKTSEGDEIANSTDLCMYLLEEYGLAAVPGDAFGEPKGIRISYAASMDTLKDGIKRLRKGLSTLTDEP
jgi:aspartate aminotransferase